MRARLVLGAVAALVLTAGPAYGAAMCVGMACPDLTFTQSNVGGIGETNILFGHPIQGPDLMISGHTVAKPHFVVDFVSTTGIFANGGQSDIDPCVNLSPSCGGSTTNGEITDLTVSIPHAGSFTDLILDPQKLLADNSLSVVVLTNVGMATYGTWGSHMSGNNYLTIQSINGAVIHSVELLDTTGLGDLKQPRISGITGTAAVPEASSMLLLGGGLLVVTQVLRRNLKKVNEEMQESFRHQ